MFISEIIAKHKKQIKYLLYRATITYDKKLIPNKKLYLTCERGYLKH